jgi:phenylalanyl-tRNA synthetase alpha chain
MSELATILAVRDLADPAAGPHAVQLVVDLIEGALATAWRVPVHRDPGPRVVTVANNYDRLRYPPDAVTRDRRYTHYVGAGRMLRSHTTARIPALLAGVRSEVVLSVPGICYRRDVIDRRHVGQPHQHDVWRIRPAGPALTGADLDELVRLVVTAVLPGRSWRTVPSAHPYTMDGREIYVDEVEIGECGLAHPEVLTGADLPAGSSGLALGLGLDRLVMLAKGIPDIRLLRSADPRVAAQLLDLTAYRPMSALPPVRRDLSLAVGTEPDPELLGDRVRGLLGADSDAVEEIEIRSVTGYDDLPDAARRRMGMTAGQRNVLLRLVLRHPTRSLTDAEANQLRDRAYAGLHEGTLREWAARG